MAGVGDVRATGRGAEIDRTGNLVITVGGRATSAAGRALRIGRWAATEPRPTQLRALALAVDA